MLKMRLYESARSDIHLLQADLVRLILPDQPGSPPYTYSAFVVPTHKPTPDPT
ncbi:MAG: hypothetical protein H8D34_15820 [Chloroflexi bacterium]|nr:hypothetical protein [Chloroflexota bacterium]